MENRIDEAKDGLDSGVHPDVIVGATFKQKVILLGVVGAEFEAPRLLLSRQDLKEIDEGGDIGVALGEWLRKGGILSGNFQLDACN